MMQKLIHGVKCYIFGTESVLSVYDDHLHAGMEVFRLQVVSQKPFLLSILNPPILSVQRFKLLPIDVTYNILYYLVLAI